MYNVIAIGRNMFYQIWDVWNKVFNFDLCNTIKFNSFKFIVTLTSYENEFTIWLSNEITNHKHEFSMTNTEEGYICFKFVNK